MLTSSGEKIYLLEKVILYALGVYIALVMIYDSRPEVTKFINIFFVFYATLSLIQHYKSKKLSINTFFIWFYLFGLLLVLGVLFAPVTNYAIMICTTYLLLSVFLFINVNNMTNRITIEMVLFLFMVAGIANSLYAVYFYGIEGIINSITNGIRLGWEISAPNSYGLYSAITAILSFFFYLFRGRKVYLLIMVLPLLIMITSSSIFFSHNKI